MAYRSVNNLVNPCNGQKGCSSELLYRTSYTKEAYEVSSIIGFFNIHSNDIFEVR